MKSIVKMLKIYIFAGWSLVAAAEDRCDAVLAEQGNIEQLSCQLTWASRLDDQNAKKYWLNVGALLGVEGYALEHSYFYYNENEFERKLAERRIEQVLKFSVNEAHRSKAYWVLASIADDEGDVVNAVKNYSLSSLYNNKASKSRLIRTCAKERLHLCVFLWGNIFIEEVSKESRYYGELNHWLSESRVHYAVSWDGQLKDLKRELNNMKKSEEFIVTLNKKLLEELGGRTN